MIEEILHPCNLMRAYYQVVGNKGSCGVDGMQVSELYGYLEEHREELKSSIRECRYLPCPILGISIPKSKGGKRLLGVPTVLDRLFQQATSQILCNYYDSSFEEQSYGFRPNRQAQSAVVRSLDYINAGLIHIVDIDLKNFFDEVDHSLLLEILYRRIKCTSTLRLIRKWVRSPIQIQGRLVKRRKGLPQGSPLSPLLSNIFLDNLDKKLMNMGVSYVRYADDFSIYCQSECEAYEIQRLLYDYLPRHLHLVVNEEKSNVRSPEDFTILGYSFGKPYRCPLESPYHLIVSPKSLLTLKTKLKEITRKTKPYSFEYRVTKLKEIQRGWVQYFRMARIQWEYESLDRWVRNRLRYCIWHDWKKPSGRCKSLIRMGVNPVLARKWSHTRMGGWATARSPILLTTITLSRLVRRGYESMTCVYESIAPHLNEPLYT